MFQNENLIAIDPLASLAYGGIQLKVHPNDLEKVQNIINDLNNHLKIVWSFQQLLKTKTRFLKLFKIYEGYYSVLIMRITFSSFIF